MEELREQGEVVEVIKFKKSRMKKVIRFMLDSKLIKAGPEMQHTRVSDYMLNKNGFLETVDKTNSATSKQFGNKFVLTDSVLTFIYIQLT